MKSAVWRRTSSPGSEGIPCNQQKNENLRIENKEVSDAAPDILFDHLAQAEENNALVSLSS